MDWKDVALAVGKIAPALGAVLAPATGGISLAIGAGIGAITTAFGLPSDAKPEDILAAVTTDPEARLKLLVAENDFKSKQRDQELEEMKAILEDVQSARNRQVESEKATGKKDVNIYVLAWTMVVGFFVLLWYLLKIPVPPDQSGVIFMLFGALSSAFGAVISYFFGSSKGSQEKSEIMGQMRKQMKG